MHLNILYSTLWNAFQTSHKKDQVNSSEADTKSGSLNELMFCVAQKNCLKLIKWIEKNAHLGIKLKKKSVYYYKLGSI